MITSLSRSKTLDLTSLSLGPAWLRRRPTEAEDREIVGEGVWRTGPRLLFRDELVAAIDSATQVVQFCSFLLGDDRLADALVRAAKRGVRVYVLTASEQRVGKVVRDDQAFEQRMAEEHKELLGKLSTAVLLRSAEHIHAKYVVVDPGSGAARAWLSTANFNKALSDGIELGVRLIGERAAALASCFNWAFWCEAERELRGPGRLMQLKQPPARPALPDGGQVFATLRDGTRLGERVLALIHSAQCEVLVASYGLEADHAAVRALVDVARRGVPVTVLTRPRPAVSTAVASLAAAGVTVVAHDKLHAKAVVVDGKALVMSANLESHGLDRGYEIGTILPAEAARHVEETLREWADRFPWVFRVDATRGKHLGEFCPAGAGLRDGVVRVIEAQGQKADNVVAEDALSLDAAPEPLMKPNGSSAVVPRRVTFTWAVEPPRLPKGARERMQEVAREEVGKDGAKRIVKERVSYDPPLFEHGGSIFVLLRDNTSVELVREAATRHGAKVVLP